MGATEMTCLSGRAHTGGDLEVFLPQQNLLFMSECTSIVCFRR
jgi:hypothetical protein